MSYLRVIPRDLFNEANLLKCLGKLALQIHEGFLPFLQMELEEGPDDQGFLIAQNPDSGGIFCSNLTVTFKGKPVHLERPLNSRKSWPLLLVTETDYIEVFDEQGTILLTKDVKV